MAFPNAVTSADASDRHFFQMAIQLCTGGTLVFWAAQIEVGISAAGTVREHLRHRKRDR